MTGKSRKSDTRPRPPQGDVSAARFVLADDDTAMTNHATTPAPAPAPAPLPTLVPIAPAPTLVPIAPYPGPPPMAPATAAALPPQPPPATSNDHPRLHHAQSVTPGPPGSVTGASSPHDKNKSKGGESDAVTIEDLALPKSIITRLAKGVLPANTQIQANAILALTKSATVFINYLANAANEHTVSSGKKTIMPADVFMAIEDTEMGFMKERLEAEFAKFNQVQTSKRSTYRKKVAAAKRASIGAPGSGENGADTGDASFMSTAAGNEDDIDIDDTDGDNRSFATAATSTPAPAGPDTKRAAKKAKMDGKMEVDDQEDLSDAETEPDEPIDEDEEEDEAVEEEEEEEEGPEEAEEDELEEREGREDGDEALDDDSD